MNKHLEAYFDASRELEPDAYQAKTPENDKYNTDLVAEIRPLAKQMDDNACGHHEGGTAYVLVEKDLFERFIALFDLYPEVDT